MSKVKITIVDRSDGDVGVTVEFIPQIAADAIPTPAQEFALRLLDRSEKIGEVKNMKAVK